MQNDFDFELEKSPNGYDPEEEGIISRVSVNGTGVESRGRSGAAASSGVSDWDEMESGGGGGGGGGELRGSPGSGGGEIRGLYEREGETVGDSDDFVRISVPDRDEVMIVEEFRVAGDGEGAESRLIDLNHGVKSEGSVYDFDAQNSGIVGSAIAAGSSSSSRGHGNQGIVTNLDDEYTDESKSSGADEGNRLQRLRVTLDDNSRSRAVSLEVGFGFVMGDMVWGKVKSHPWWPGYIFNEAFAAPQVRHTKREGHVLVAFFGDNSYGWFEASELIPYEPNYAEKWQQTFSRNFMKAVEDSEDEVSRRAALGLSCRCRNDHNFRPADVPGYLSVDVVDYEAGGIYSVGQIRRARDGFQPRAVLSFVKQLALTPNDVERRNIDFIKHKSMSLAYRRAKFEDFDETYAQAFGQQPVRPTKLSPSEIDQSVRVKGLFSGRQVFAEALGGRKSSGKPLKTKEPGKKDKYLLKRRDEPAKAHQISQENVSSLLPISYRDEPSASAAGGYVLHWRDHVVSTSEQVPIARRDQGLGSSVGIGVDEGPTRIGEFDTTRKGLSTGLAQHHGPSVIAGGQEPCALSRGPDPGKKIKAAKRLAGEFSSEKSDLAQKKKRRKKVMADLGSVDPHKQTLASLGRVADKPMDIATGLREEPTLSQPRKDVQTTNSLSPPAMQMPPDGTWESEVEFPELLSDLQALALNPFHGAQRHRPAIAKTVFLRFRSLVFQKSLVAQPLVSESQEARTLRPPPVSGPPANAAATTLAVGTAGVNAAVAGGENIRSMPPPSKPSKPVGRLDDPTRAGKKRTPSERPKETAAKKMKKIGDVKPSGADNKVVQKTSEMQRTDGRAKDAAATVPPPVQRKPKVGSLKKTEPPRRVEEPTYLVIKFPPGSSLPTSMELKARFARFGSMDPEGNRVFYKTSTCRVLYLYKDDAERAQQYAESVFPSANSVYVRPVSARAEDTANEPVPAQPPAPAVPPKSILRKSNGDESGPGSRGARVRFNVGDDASATREVQTMDYRNKNSSFDQEPTTGTSSSVAMDFTSYQKVMSASNALASPSLPPLLPLPPFPPLPPPPYSRAVHNPQYVETAPRTNHNYNPIMGLPAEAPITMGLSVAHAPTVDISQQMMSLLLRCNDIVANLTSTLGYVPYHPL